MTLNPSDRKVGGFAPRPRGRRPDDDRINDYGSVKIELASPSDIRSWSFGEVKRPDTIHYQTYRPEKDGLFCERIFGPERDWECACGKYKGIIHKGIICDRCGVKITHSCVRRKRLGHINLAAPIVHIWFYKGLHSPLSILLNMKAADLERVILFQDYVVTDPGKTPLKYQQVLTEDEYSVAHEQYRDDFKAQMGAEAIKALLGKLDLPGLANDLREALKKTNSKQKIKDLAQRLKLVESIRTSGNRPEWMVMDVIPVIPPDLRPLVLLESGNFATSDLNDLYRGPINRNNCLKKWMDLNFSEPVIRNEKRMLQQAVDALFDNGRRRCPFQGGADRPLKSLTDMIKGKQGRFRENLLGKRVDYSACALIVPDPELKLHQCGLPKKIALELYRAFILPKLKDRILADTIEAAKKMRERPNWPIWDPREEDVYQDPGPSPMEAAKKMLERPNWQIWDLLEEVVHQHPVLLNHTPTLTRMGIQAFEPVLVDGNAIRIHPLVCKGFNADFDGDQMAVHLPLSLEAQAEAHVLMLATNNIFSPASGLPIVSPVQDIVLGIYYVTSDRGAESVKPGVRTVRFRDGNNYPAYTHPHEAMTAHDLGRIGMHARIIMRLPVGKGVIEADKQYSPNDNKIITTVGRCLFNDILDPRMPFYNYPLGQKGTMRVISDCYAQLGRPVTLDLLDKMKDLGFRQATLAGVSFGITDATIPARKPQILAESQAKVDQIEKDFHANAITEGERYNQIVDVWIHAREEVTKALLQALKEDKRSYDPNYLNPVVLMSDSGARINVDQIRQLAGMRGLMSKPSGEIIEAPVKANFREGLSVLEYFATTQGIPSGLAAKSSRMAHCDYLTRKLADVAQNVVITGLDCGTLKGIPKSAIYKGKQVSVPLREVIVGRVARENIVNPTTDETIVHENQIITAEMARQIQALGMVAIRVRSPLTCETPLGLCAKCYGRDLSTGKLVEEGMAVGIIAAQSIGEGGTQLTMRTFHTGGLPRVTEVFEARNPKDPAAMAEIPGRVELRTDKRCGKVTIIIRSESGMEREHHVPHDRHLLVHTGDYVEAGDPLTEGPLVLQDILAIRGEEALQQYLLSEVQGVYRGHGVTLDDKHIEIILAQMLRKVKVDNVGDSGLLPGDVVDKFRFLEEHKRLASSLKIIKPGDTEFRQDEIISKDKAEAANAAVEAKGGKPCKTRRPRPATAKTLLLGITKASLQSESFLSAVSFQESTKVFTEAALAGKVDELRGLTENVILGHLIQAGTSFKPYMEMRIKRDIELGELPSLAREELTKAEINQAVQQALTGQDQ